MAMKTRRMKKCSRHTRCRDAAVRYDAKGGERHQSFLLLLSDAREPDAFATDARPGCQGPALLCDSSNAISLQMWAPAIKPFFISHAIQPIAILPSLKQNAHILVPAEIRWPCSRQRERHIASWMRSRCSARAADHILLAVCRTCPILLLCSLLDTVDALSLPDCLATEPICFCIVDLAGSFSTPYSRRTR